MVLARSESGRVKTVQTLPRPPAEGDAGDCHPTITVAMKDYIAEEQS